jgi:hypothetical protein
MANQIKCSFKIQEREQTLAQLKQKEFQKVQQEYQEQQKD